jgi:hypothetical protein
VFLVPMITAAMAMITRRISPLAASRRNGRGGGTRGGGGRSRRSIYKRVASVRGGEIARATQSLGLGEHLLLALPPLLFVFEQICRVLDNLGEALSKRVGS